MPEQQKNIIQLIEENNNNLDLWEMNEQGLYAQEQFDTMVHRGAAVVRPMYADNVIDAVHNLG